MTLMSVSKCARLEVGKGGQDQRLSARMAMTENPNVRGVCPGDGSKRQRKWKAGVGPIYRHKRGGL